jgi:hypothetical protein
VCVQVIVENNTPVRREELRVVMAVALDPDVVKELQAPTGTPAGLILNLLTAWAMLLRNKRRDERFNPAYAEKRRRLEAMPPVHIERAALAERVAAQAEHDERVETKPLKDNNNDDDGSTVVTIRYDGESAEQQQTHPRSKRRTPLTVAEDALLNPVVPNMDPFTMLINLFGSWVRSGDKPHQDRRKQDAANEEALRTARANAVAEAVLALERAAIEAEAIAEVEAEGHFKHALNDLLKRKFNASHEPQENHEKRRKRETNDIADVTNSTTTTTNDIPTDHTVQADFVDHWVNSYDDLRKRKFSRADAPLTSQLKATYMGGIRLHHSGVGSEDALLSKLKSTIQNTPVDLSEDSQAQLAQHWRNAYLDLDKRNITGGDAVLARQLRDTYSKAHSVMNKLQSTLENITSELGDGIAEAGSDLGKSAKRITTDAVGTAVGLGRTLIDTSKNLYDDVAHANSSDVVGIALKVGQDAVRGVKEAVQDVTKSVVRIGEDIEESASNLLTNIFGRFRRLEHVVQQGFVQVTNGNDDVKDKIHTLDQKVRRSVPDYSRDGRNQALPSNGWSAREESPPQINDQGQYIGHKTQPLDFNDNGEQRLRGRPLYSDNDPVYGNHRMLRGAGGIYHPVPAGTYRYNIRNNMDTVDVRVEYKFGTYVETRYRARMQHVPNVMIDNRNFFGQAEQKFGERQNKLGGDQRGHVIGRQLGGPLDAWNLLPQAGTVNQGYGEPLNWRTVENNVAAWLNTAGNTVDWVLDVDYFNHVPRPSNFRLEVTYYRQGAAAPHHTHNLQCENVQNVFCTGQIT